MGLLWLRQEEKKTVFVYKETRKTSPTSSRFPLEMLQIDVCVWVSNRTDRVGVQINRNQYFKKKTLLYIELKTSSKPIEANSTCIATYQVHESFPTESSQMAELGNMANRY